MRKKIPIIFSVSNKINILSIITFLGSFYTSEGYRTTDDVTEMIISQVIIFGVYGTIFYLGLKLVNQYLNQVKFNSPKKIVRIIFFSIEVIFLIAYSYLLWISFTEMQEIKFSRFNSSKVFWLVGLIGMYLGYLSSLVRVVFTWPFFKMVKDQHFEFVNTIGKTGHNI